MDRTREIAGGAAVAGCCGLLLVECADLPCAEARLPLWWDDASYAAWQASDHGADAGYNTNGPCPSLIVNELPADGLPF